MPALAKAPDKRSRGGLNHGLIVFLNRAAGGGYEIPATGNDPLGATWGTPHYYGSLTKSKLARDDNGIFIFDTSIVEQDIARRNLLLDLAPASTTGNAEEPELELEDGTKLAGTDSGADDTTLPVVMLFYFGSQISSKDQVFASVMQASRATSIEFDRGQWSQVALQLKSIDGKNYLPVAPAGDTNFAGITFANLTGNAKFGKWFAEV